MAMDIPVGERSILEWDEGDVHLWLSNLGFPQYENQIREHNISGDVLCLLHPDTLKAVGVSTVGQRLAILKAVYQTKLAHNVPFESDHYVPPSEAPEHQANVSIEKLCDVVKEQDQRLRQLEEDNKRLNDTLQSFLEEFTGSRASQGRSARDEPSLRRQPSFKWAQYVKPAKSPTKPDNVESPHHSPQQLESDSPYNRTPQPQYQTITTPSDRQRGQASSSTDSPNSAQLTASSSKAQRQESSDNLKSFKVSLEDPTWKVLPAALKKYKINNDNWENYAMFICYGSPGNRIERCLSYDEKPLILFQKLKDAKKNPVFMLKHIKDIRSPIAVAQQKHALRKASVSSEPPSGDTNKSIPAGQGRAVSRPPKLEVNDLSVSAPLTGTTPQAGWPEVMSPSLDNRERAEEFGGNGSNTVNAPVSVSVSTPPSGDSTSGHTSTKSRNISIASTATVVEGSGASVREMPIPISEVSYAVAIYPYMAEQEDEFDVVVGDTFVILSRARGWWVVQRDPTGSGIVDTDTSTQGWVPAGCLLETSVPVASAIAEATASKAGNSLGSPPSSPLSKTPILPLNIISTSFPGVALMDYKKKGEEELDLIKDDALRVFKRYNHWSYAVKEEGGYRGWVPSWFIGKVPTVGGAPPTPSTTSVPTLMNPPIVNLEADSNNQTQVSPMSSAFPVQTR
ncbi:hypothetical protein SERLA73DRAFT_93174 [Serpula lacrymans var. lacrymans S7.3]|uniref:Protein kinase regulator n=2 Tax=Serpula lacrymans var. lacrymans TaxID=341189 RepID=F8Q500_SERL3|nr:uncharacterized protein SERLADRAFT_451080 [Serpula lacrymans var. lacrymans S7.9]EGN96627.1 hypothetical protein SERLA73DRAFT_93174 [Serpula lacrymans var. lacrymans S7.3]EGO22194.1 hypothetical protein SERLADRAFT_451080 [Serpula lacrymans var. lacrymans S7.9]